MATVYVCLLFVIFNISTASNQTTHTITGLYCQDPDTGNLHAVNTTWRSKSFCGNYTCKIKRRNFTTTEYNPIKIVNISMDNESFTSETLTSDEKMYQTTRESVHEEQTKNGLTKTLSDEQTVKLNTERYSVLNSILGVEIKKNISADRGKNKNITDMSTSPSETFSTYVSASKTDKTLDKPVTKEYQKEASAEENDDRYLSESEINDIAEALHSVKKSDLEAIIDIYNLAQEIYKEVESIGTTTDKILKKSTSPLNKIPNTQENSKVQTSYWYDPLNIPKDAKLVSTVPTPLVVSRFYPTTYFRGSIMEKNLQKIPYYYPISDFQRMSSYVKPTDDQNILDKVEIKPYSKLHTFVQTPNINQGNAPLLKVQNPSPSLLPYPFSFVHHNDVSLYPTNYNYPYPYPWEKLSSYDKNRNYFHSYIDVYNIPKPSIVTDAYPVLEKRMDQPSENKEYKSINTVNKGGIKNLPDWQPEQLPAQLVDEIKVNVMNKTKLVNLSPRKNVKVELVGKVIKLDDLVRDKRFDINDEELEYDTYLEKVTCESSTEIGFFRYGNTTEPYPACCPQRIES